MPRLSPALAASDFGVVVLAACLSLPQLPHFDGSAVARADPARPASLEGAGDGAWVALPPPSARAGSSAIYDPVRNRVVLFGGDDGTFSPPPETWTWSLGGEAGWNSLDPGLLLPQGRTEHSAIYDPVRDRMVVFGGRIPCAYANCAALSDVLALSFSGTPGWSSVSGGDPGWGQFGHTAIYDPLRDRMIVFGGSRYGYRTNEVWALALGGTPTWTLLEPTGVRPSARRAHSAIYDPEGDRMVIFGGRDGSSAIDDVWELVLAGTPYWKELTPSGARPAARGEHSASYDPVRNRMVVFGGIGNDAVSRHDVWALTLTESPEWTELSPNGVQPPRANHAAIYDPLADRIVLFGGGQYGGELPNTPTNDTWSLSLVGSPSWLQLDSGGPGSLADHSMIYDPARDRVLVFGGSPSYPMHNNDVWALSLAGRPAWTLLDVSGPRPPPRSGHVAIHDPVRDRMVIFGGEGRGLNEYLGDTWALSLGENPAWSQIVCCSVGPAGRAQATAVYDPAGDRMLLFGGLNPATFNDVWALPLSGASSWSELGPSGALPPRGYGHAAVYDPLRQRMLVLGGSTSDDNVWQLTLGEAPAWSAWTPGGYPALPRTEHAVVYDPVRDRIVMHAGKNNGPSDEAWFLSLGENPSWTLMSQAGSRPAQRAAHGVVYDPLRDRMVMFGGERFNDAWALTWGGVVEVPAGELPALSGIARVLPNPARNPVIFEIDLARTGSHTLLSIHDVRGRLVDRLDLRGLPAGIHRVWWTGTSRGGERVPFGVYFARLGSDARQPAHRFVFIP